MPCTSKAGYSPITILLPGKQLTAYLRNLAKRSRHPEENGSVQTQARGEGEKKETGTDKQVLKHSFFFFLLCTSICQCLRNISSPAAAKGDAQLPPDSLRGLRPSTPNQDARYYSQLWWRRSSVFCRGLAALALNMTSSLHLPQLKLFASYLMKKSCQIKSVPRTRIFVKK